MSDRYIIANCPCYDTEYEECLNTFRDEYEKCYDCTDCKMKQIVELCKDKMNTEFNSGSMFAEELLRLFDIQEVE